MLYNERATRGEQALDIAKKMMVAARTAPKGKGIDIIECAVVDGPEKDRLAQEMRAVAEERGHKFFIRDAACIDASACVLLVGTAERVQGLDCGHCGSSRCADRAPGVPCAINSVDVGIAIGAACSVACDARVDTRVLFSAGFAAQRLRYLGDCRQVYALPVSVSSKSPFFDRPSPVPASAVPAASAASAVPTAPAVSVVPTSPAGPAESVADSEAHEGLARLRAALRETGGLTVAFSGGVDSTFLLAVAAQELGDRVLAVSATSPVFPARELAEAKAFCAERGIAHLVVPSAELDAPGFRDNPPERCYLCKHAIFSELRRIAGDKGFEVLVDGTNVDDEGDYRPGMRALAELGVRSPLREAGLTKAAIRALSREMGLPTWSKPSFACLASRVPYHERITDEKLSRIDAAEQYLLGRGLTQVRVRVHGDVARIEVPPTDVSGLALEPARSEILSELKRIGFLYVTLDLGGYRSGSMNEALA